MKWGRSKSGRRGMARIGRIAGLVLLWFVGLSVAWVLLYRFVPPPVTITMMGEWAQGRSITRRWVPLSRIDRNMPRAAIAAEDSRFCAHWGFDFEAIRAAAERKADGVRLRGGSTISQQTAKNVFLWQGRSWVRKGLEAWFTLLIEALWPKHRLMEVYLNVAETGIATYGVDEGARRYFGHGAGKLSRTEAGRIAAVLPQPKKRAGSSPAGFTRRYGNSIAARIGVVQRDRLDACLWR